MTTLESLLSLPLVHTGGVVFMHFLWQGTALALLFAVVLHFLRRRSPQSRWLASCVALGLMLIAPAITAYVVFPEAKASVIVTSSSPPPAIAATPVFVGHAAMAPFPATAVVPISPTPMPWSSRAYDFVQPLLPWAAVLWVLGVMGLSLWRLCGWLQAQRLRRRQARPVSEAVRAAVARLRQQLAVSRPVLVLESALATVPMVIGWLRPVVLLPVSTLTGLNAAQLEAVLAHELAHIRRYDCLVRLVQVLAETVLFYHPAVWWISRRIRTESEFCCDELAAATCGDRRTYAEAMAALIELQAEVPQLAAAATGGQMVARIRRVLRLPETDHGVRPGWLAGMILLAVLLAGGVIGVGCLGNKQSDTGLSAGELVRRYAASTSWQRATAMKVHIEGKVQLDNSDPALNFIREVVIRRNGDLIEANGDERNLNASGKEEKHTRTVELVGSDFSLDASKGDDSPWSASLDRTLQNPRDHLLRDAFTGTFLDGAVYGFGSPDMAGFLSNSKDLHVGSQMEQIEGTPCYLVEGSNQYGSVKIWVAPDKGYTALKYELRKGENDLLEGETPGRVLKTTNTKGWLVVVDGVAIDKIGETYVPVAGRMTTTATMKDGSAKTDHITCRRSEIQLNPDFAQLHAFEVQLPEGTRVYNENSAGTKWFECRHGKLVSIDDASVTLPPTPATPANVKSGEKPAATNALAELPGLPVKVYGEFDFVEDPPDYGGSSPRPVTVRQNGEREDVGVSNRPGRKKLQELIEKTVRNGEPWESAGGRAAIRFDEAQWKVLVRQTPQGHAELAALISELSRLLEKRGQVTVEAQFLCTSRDDADRLQLTGQTFKDNRGGNTMFLNPEQATAWRKEAEGLPSAAVLFAPHLTLWNGQRAWIMDGIQEEALLPRVDQPDLPKEAAHLEYGNVLVVRSTISADRRYAQLALDMFFGSKDEGEPKRADKLATYLFSSIPQLSVAMPDGQAMLVRVPLNMRRLVGLRASNEAELKSTGLRLQEVYEPLDKKAQPEQVLWLLVKAKIAAKPATEPTPANVKSDADPAAAPKTHQLTWENYGGTGDKNQAVFLLDGQRLGQGAAGLEKLRQEIARMPRGAAIEVVPYYGDGEGVHRSYPFDDFALFKFAESHGVAFRVPSAG